MPKKILLVDDESDFLELSTTTLENEGYIVETAKNGREAIGAYIASFYRKKPIDLILLDIRMPDLNGLEVLELIRQEEKYRGVDEKLGVPIIMVTAYDKPWMDPLLIKGSTDFIVKSPNDQEMLTKIEQKLEEREKG